MSDKISFISGNFNIIHAGHIRLFKFAKSISDKLIIGLYSDQLINDESFIEEKIRFEYLSQLKLVDQIILIKKSLKKTIMDIKPNFIVKGFEFTNIENEESKIIKKIRCELVFSSGETNITKHNLNNFSNLNLKLPNDFLNRHSIKKDHLHSTIEKFKNIRVTIIGDLIVDEYILCNPIGMSKETNNIVYSYEDKKKYLGGAGIVAAHASNLGANVNLISSCGYDEDGIFAIKKLKENKVKVKLLKKKFIKTINKKRFKFGNENLFRLNVLNNKVIDKKLSDEIYEHFKKISKYTDVLIFSDFNYGLLDEKLIEKIIKIAKNNRIFIAADSQTSSQVGDIKKFNDCNLVTPTEYEARLNINDNKSGLVILSEKLRKNIRSENIILTQGGDGIFIHAYDKKKNNYINDTIKSLNKFAHDISGAGDSFLIACAMSMKITKNIWLSSLLGSVASAIQISREGNIPLTSSILKENIKKY